jgi:hypothetical protein
LFGFCSPLKLTHSVATIGGSISDVAMYASAVTAVGGYEHEIPHLVFASVEELLRTGEYFCSNKYVFLFVEDTYCIGIYQPGLFRKLPHRKRHQELIQLYNTPPSFGAATSLSSESTPDICALLTTYIMKLPSPLLPSSLFPAFWAWCIKPTVKRETAQREKDEHEDDQYQYRHHSRRPKLDPRAAWHKARLDGLRKLQLIDSDPSTLAQETLQIEIAVLLLRLLPAANFSLLVYLLAFFSQVPLSPENGVSFDDLSRLFGHKLLGGSCAVAAKSGMEWLLTRWPRIADGLGVEDECCEKRAEREEQERKTLGAPQDGEVREPSQVEVDMPETDSHLPYLVSAPDVMRTPTIAGGNGDDDDAKSLHLGADDIFLLPSEGLFDMSEMDTTGGSSSSLSPLSLFFLIR